MSSIIQKKFKPNVVYELLIHGVYPYAGCHCSSRDFIYKYSIIGTSGNYLAAARDKGFITFQEYRDNVELINVWEFDTKEEAQNFETLKIQELKEKYGDLCKNKALYGNQHRNKGVSFKSPSKETRLKMSEARKNYLKIHEAWNKGKPGTCLGRHWYTNGTINVRSYDCPEGFWIGQTR